MIKPKLLELWKRQGLTPEQMNERADALNIELPPELKLISDTSPVIHHAIEPQTKSKRIGKRFNPISFRPEKEIKEFLETLENKSEFLNQLIKNYIIKNGN